VLTELVDLAELHKGYLSYRGRALQSRVDKAEQSAEVIVGAGNDRNTGNS